MYEMKPEYYIGIDMIDEEHKQLFKYADEAYELLHDEFTPDKYNRNYPKLFNIDTDSSYYIYYGEYQQAAGYSPRNKLCRYGTWSYAA